VAELRPERHVDVGSRVDYAGQLTSVTKVTFVDIRPLEVELDDFESVAGSILDLPFADRSLESVSCLHVAEHIGLGRYGDPLDPLGTKKAARELERVLAPGGQLLFSGPVGRSRLCFNAHRVHDPYEVLAMFPQLELVEFSGVDDHGVFRRHRSLDELVGSEYACGMFLLRRPPIRGMYSQLVRAGDLVFDVGANLGNRTEAFLALGARVVAIEPQRECVKHLRRRWPDEDRLTVVPAAVSDSEGQGELFVSEASTLTSMAPEWIEAIVASGRFSGYSWDQRITVPTTTLTRLVAEHGRPAFCKIDVEGFEAKVLEGLDQPLPAVSLEFAKEALHMTRRCIERLMELGPTEFNFSLGESLEWALPRWVSGPELLAALERLPDQELPWGDVYARAASSEEHGLPSS
jgi:FkbM family methyltransferase